jgi:hypothetical protein
MTSGKYSSNQNSEDTQTFEDRDYFVHGPNVYTRGEYAWLLKMLMFPDSQIEKKMVWPSKISPFWISLMRDKGYKQWMVQLKRNGEVVQTHEKPGISLFYNSSTPYCFHFHGTDICVYTLAKDLDHALKNAEKKRLEQFLSKAWLGAIQDYEENQRLIEQNKKSFSQAMWPGINQFYANQMSTTP